MDDRATIADLEVYGLSIRLINGLEDRLGFIYADDLAGVTEAQLSLAGGRAGLFGPSGIAQIRTALRNFLGGRQVKSVHECVVSDGGDDD